MTKNFYKYIMFICSMYDWAYLKSVYVEEKG